MTRVLHLVTAEGPIPRAALPALVADVTRHEPGDHHTLLLGDESLRDAADQAGLTDCTLLPEPTGLLRTHPLFNPRLRKPLAEAEQIDCWTHRAAELTQRAGAVTVQARFHPEHRVALAEQYTDASRLEGQDRAGLRAKWGVAEDDHVLALVGNPGSTSDTDAAMMAMQMCRGVLDFRESPAKKLVLLCHPLQPSRCKAGTALRLADHGDVVVQEPALSTPWEVLPGCDAALCPDGASTLPLGAWWARKAGLPILSALTGQARELAHAVTRWMAGEPVAESPLDRMIPTA